MNALVATASHILHIEIHFPFTHRIHKDIDRALSPGGETYTRYINILRTVVSNSDSRNVESNIRKELQGIHIKCIEIKTIHDRGHTGLITCDDFLVEIALELDPGNIIKFD